MISQNFITESTDTNTESSVFVGLPDIPVQCNVLYATKQEAMDAPLGNIKLAFCSSSGLIYNADFDEDLMAYDVEYENALHHSPRFQSFASGLAQSLVDRYNVRDKDLVEIGCGDGYFLRLLCDVGENRGWGFDPTLSTSGGDGASADDDRVTIFQEYFDPARMPKTPDFVCCRHVLEHIPDPLYFLRSLRPKLGGATVYFEVPDARYTLERGGFWDILYEHRSYFTDVSISAVFRRAGFDVFRTGSTYEGQFLQIEAKPANIANDSATCLESNEDGISALKQHVETFAQRLEEKIWIHARELERRASEGQRVALWGAGTKGVMFLNLVDRERRAACVVDRNPKKHGCFVSGTGHPIVSPESLAESPPDAVYLMNPAYQDEVREQLAELGVRCELLPV